MTDYSSKFRNSGGQRYTKGLFLETSETPDTVLYTLKDRDWTATNGQTYPSIYRLYLELNDPLEFTFGNTYFESYDHWISCAQAYFMRDLVQRMRSELELKLRSEALVRIREDAKSGSKSAAQANKFLVDRGWVDKNTKGRPTKAAVKKEADRLAADQLRIDEDFNRIVSSKDLQ